MKKELREQILSGAIEDVLIERAEASLTDEQRKLYEMQLSSGKKNIFIAYLIWFFFSEFQLHMIYLGILDKAHLMALRITALILSYFIIGVFILFPLAIYDAIKMPSYMKDAERLRKANILFRMVRDDEKTNSSEENFDFATPSLSLDPLLDNSEQIDLSENGETNFDEEIETIADEEVVAETGEEVVAETDKEVVAEIDEEVVAEIDEEVETNKSEKVEIGVENSNNDVEKS